MTVVPDRGDKQNRGPQGEVSSHDQSIAMKPRMSEMMKKND